MYVTAADAGSDFYTMQEYMEGGFWDFDEVDRGSCRTGSLSCPIGDWASGI